MLYLPRASTPTASPTWPSKSSSKDAARPIACGNTVAVPARPHAMNALVPPVVCRDAQMRNGRSPAEHWLIFSFSVICATVRVPAPGIVPVFGYDLSFCTYPLSSYFVSLAHNAKAKDCEGLTFILRRHADFYVVLARRFLLANRIVAWQWVHPTSLGS